MVMHPCNPDTQEAEVGGSWFKTSLGKSVRPYLKNNYSKKEGRMTQETEHLSCKHKFLSSKPQYCQKKKKRKRNMVLPGQVEQAGPMCY
jgi:hypothetical protein